MNKGFKGLLVALVAVGCVSASQSNNKTHLNTLLRSEYAAGSTTFHEMKADKNNDLLGGNFALTGFYGRSANGSHLAKNFGADGGDTVTVINGAAGVAIKALKTNRPSVVADFLLHTQGATTANTLAGVFRFEPRQVIYGGRLDYYHRLDMLFEGLFAGLKTSIVHVDHNINFKTDTSTGEGGTTEGKIYTEDILRGKTITRALVGGTQKNAQSALKYAKMCRNSKTGLTDLEAYVGWRFLEDKNYHAGINACVVLPTASKPSPEFLWAARTGQSKFGIGAGADGSAVLWEEEDENFKVLGGFQYKYLFEGSEKRTFGLNKLRYRDAGSQQQVVNFPIWSQYYLVGKTGAKGLQPLANVSTLKVDVKPGSMLEGNVTFAYNNGGFTLDFGYNLFWKEAEKVSLKNGSCSTTACNLSDKWTDNTYGVANKVYAATVDFNANGSNTTNFLTDKSGYIKSTDLYKEGSESAAQLIHTLFTGVGYITSWEYPVMVGAGVAYDIPANNKDAAEGYSFWAKAGVSF